jgi:hypothetical protein
LTACIAVISVVGAAFGSAAQADLLINAPQTRVCLGHAITVGVWNRPTHAPFNTREPFAVRITRAGTLQFFVRGAAPTHWRYWSFFPDLVGRYRVEYLPRTRFTTFWTNVVNC